MIPSLEVNVEHFLFLECTLNDFYGYLKNEMQGPVWEKYSTRNAGNEGVAKHSVVIY
jgi:hypothetical protein